LIKQETSLKDVWILKPEVFKDFRGDYICTFHKEQYDLLVREDNGQQVKFVESCIVRSSKHVLRGIHYSPDDWKIYQCLNGKIMYTYINLDEQDPEYLKQETFILEPYDQILKHPRYGTVFFSLEDNTILLYHQSEYYNKDNPNQKTFKWNDPRFKIYIPYPPVLSKRDLEGHYEFRTTRF
jgi:dTDP-4-dehydrorhamnose 3,5-epimerase